MMLKGVVIMKKVSSFLTLVTILIFSLTGCKHPPYATQHELFEDIVFLVNSGVSESKFCDIYIINFADDQLYKCEGENGYYSELSAIILPLGYLDEVVIQYEVENEKVYFFFIHNDEKINVGYVLVSYERYIYGIK